MEGLRGRLSKKEKINEQRGKKGKYGEEERKIEKSTNGNKAFRVLCVWFQLGRDGRESS